MSTHENQAYHHVQHHHRDADVFTSTERYYNLSQGVTTPIDLPNGILWNLTELNVSGASASAAVAVNNRTDVPFTVAGDYDDLSYVSRATKWRNGTPTTYNGYWSSLDASSATAVNDAETVVGYINKYDSVLGYNHTIRPFVWPWIGGVSLLDTLPSGGSTEATAISSGSIVGFGKNSAGYNRAIRWSGTAAYDLETLAGDSPALQSFAYGVNNAGFIIGKSRYTLSNTRQHAFLFQPNGSYDWHLQKLGNSAIDLGVLRNGDNSEAYAINNRNEVVGASQTSGTSAWRAFIRKPGQSPMEINPPSGTAHTYAYGINDSSVVVGAYGTSPFIWQEGIGSRDLNSYRSNPYFTIYVAEAINNQNVVVGYGYGSSGYRAFVLSPP